MVLGSWGWRLTLSSCSTSLKKCVFEGLEGSTKSTNGAQAGSGAKGLVSGGEGGMGSGLTNGGVGGVGRRPPFGQALRRTGSRSGDRVATPHNPQFQQLSPGQH